MKMIAGFNGDLDRPTYRVSIFRLCMSKAARFSRQADGIYYLQYCVLPLL